MLIRFSAICAVGGAIAAAIFRISLHEANAQTNIWKECGTQYQAAKGSDALNGLSWRDFLESCRPRMDEKAKLASSDGVIAQPNSVPADVLKKCAAQYQTAKETNGLNGLSWADFFKSCRNGGTERPPLGQAAAGSSSVAPRKATAASAPVIAPIAATAPGSTEAAPVASSPSAPVAAPARGAASIAPPQPNEANRPANGNSARAPVGPSVSETLMREKLRQKKCAAQWRAQKAELRKANPAANWHKYWSECDRRLKVSGG
jgi:hypothetical protein